MNFSQAFAASALTTLAFTAPAAAAPAPASASAETGEDRLRLVYYVGSKARGGEAATPEEAAMLDRLHRLSPLVTLTEELPIRADPLFEAHRYDCMVSLRFSSSQPRPETLSSRPQMRVEYLYYHLRGAPPPPADAVRVARNRRMADWPATLNGIPYAELIGTNDVIQTVDLLKARRVDYILAYPGNMVGLPEVQSGQIEPVPGLPPARTAQILITCHTSDRARQFLEQLDSLTPPLTDTTVSQ